VTRYIPRLFIFLFLFFFFYSLTGIGTNTSLNVFCPTVVVIMKPGLMPTSFIKETCRYSGLPSARKYDANHSAKSSPGEKKKKKLSAFGAFSKNNNWWSWLWAKALRTLKALRRLTRQWPNQYLINWIEVQWSMFIKEGLAECRANV